MGSEREPTIGVRAYWCGAFRVWGLVTVALLGAFGVTVIGGAAVELATGRHLLWLFNTSAAIFALAIVAFFVAYGLQALAWQAL
jgi:hypothetical protein